MSSSIRDFSARNGAIVAWGGIQSENIMVRPYCPVVTVLLIASVASATARADALQSTDVAEAPRLLDLSGWQLVWQDEFDYADEDLDERWEAQNGPSRHILCSRWRENVVVKDGVLHLVNKKQRRGGQEWTSGSIWTKKKFKYGYFECRYRYAEATGTNNSFWLMTRGPEPSVGKRFEIDINEGHYPNEINTNIHNWSDVSIGADGTKTHSYAHKGFAYGMRPDYSLPLEIPVTTKRLRLTSTSSPHFHIREFRVFGPNESYPEPLSETADQDVPGLTNFARHPKVEITASGALNEKTKPADAADGT